jgi:hypothetical protein
MLSGSDTNEVEHDSHINVTHCDTVNGTKKQQLPQDGTYHLTVLLCSSTDTGKMLPAFLSLSSLSVSESFLPVGFFKI